MAILEHLLNAIGWRPVVHCVNHNFSAHHRRVEGRELVERHGQNHDVGVFDGIPCPSRLGPGCHHLGNECDLLGTVRSRNRHLEARVDCDSRDHWPNMPRTKHGDTRQPYGRQCCASHVRSPPARAIKPGWRWLCSAWTTWASASYCSGVSASAKCFFMARMWGAVARLKIRAPSRGRETSAPRLRVAQSSR